MLYRATARRATHKTRFMQSPIMASVAVTVRRLCNVSR
ncbi:hypothetical protein OKW30_004862 [Paraburkholderia sp. Clong3]